MCHVINISLLIERASLQSVGIRKFLEEHKGWEEYVNGPLLAMKRTLSGNTSNMEVNSIFQQEEDHVPSDISAYQYMISQGFTDFPDDFTNEEEFYEEHEMTFEADQQFDATFNTDEQKFSPSLDDDDHDSSDDDSDDYGDSDEELPQNDESEDSYLKM